MPIMTTHGDINERVGKLETSVGNLHSEVADLKTSMSQGFREISATLSQNSKTNWGVVFAGLAIGGSLYAAAIRPLQSDISRVADDVHSVGNAEKETQAVIGSLKIRLAEIDTELDMAKADVKRINDYGSPVTITRLSLLEMRDKERERERGREHGAVPENMRP